MVVYPFTNQQTQPIPTAHANPHHHCGSHPQHHRATATATGEVGLADALWLRCKALPTLRSGGDIPKIVSVHEPLGISHGISISLHRHLRENDLRYIDVSWFSWFLMVTMSDGDKNHSINDMVTNHYYMVST